MRSRFLILATVAVLMIGAFLLFNASSRSLVSPSPYAAPPIGVHTFFPSPQPRRRILTIEAATDVSFMRDFIKVFQRSHPDIAVLYVDMLSSELLEHGLKDCAAQDQAPDLFISISTDHLVEMANHGCADTLAAGAAEPALAEWRHEVVGFSLEPAVFIYNRRQVRRALVPRGHLALIEAMRADPAAWQGRIGTYDIEQAGTGYSYASMDARQAATYGRLIESFGRGKVKTYCCSNEMVDAVAAGRLAFAYNVQLSYAYAGQRAGQPIGVVLPDDYQSVQLRSAMVTRHARNPTEAAAFIQSLLSSEGQKVALGLITPPPNSETLGRLDPPGSGVPLVLNSSLLALRDQARRRHFISEWQRAVRPPPSETEESSPPVLSQPR